MSADELSRLSRRIAGGDIEAARRAVVLLGGSLDAPAAALDILRPWWTSAIRETAVHVARATRESKDDLSHERIATMIDQRMPWRPESPGSVFGKATAGFLMLAVALKDETRAPPFPGINRWSDDDYWNAKRVFRLEVIREILGDASLREAVEGAGYEPGTWEWDVQRASGL